MWAKIGTIKKLDPKKQKMIFSRIFVKPLGENSAFINTRPLNNIY